MLAGAALAAAVAVSAPSAAQVEAIQPTYQLDRKRDVRGPLDIVRVAMSNRLDGTLRGDLKLRRAWDTASVGDGGSLCLKLYVRADPDGELPEYLVCATPPATGEELAGRVLRTRANGRPRVLGEAVVARPTTRMLHLTFDPDLIGRPARLRFAGESVWRGERCPRAAGCADLAPDPPAARRFRLRRNNSSG
jgi:hypothetical protein